MPTKQKSRKSVPKTRAPIRKRKNTVSRYNQGSFATLNRRDPFKLRSNFKITYSELVNLTTGTGNNYGTQHSFGLNCANGPNLVSPLSHQQPYGHDSIMSLYRKFKVMKCYLHLEWTDPSADGVQLSSVLQAPDGVLSMTGLGLDRVPEIPNNDTRMINNSGGQKVIQKKLVKLSTLSGYTDEQFRNEMDLFQSDFSGTQTVKPTKNPSLNIACASVTSTSTTIKCRVTLTFHLQAFERKTLPQS